MNGVTEVEEADDFIKVSVLLGQANTLNHQSTVENKEIVSYEDFLDGIDLDSDNEDEQQ